MINFNHGVTPIKTSAKLNKDTNDELVDANLYNKVIRSLRYICNTRPTIFKSVGLVIKFMESSRSCHLLVAKRILIYIKGSANNGILVPN